MGIQLVVSKGRRIFLPNIKLFPQIRHPVCVKTADLHFHVHMSLQFVMSSTMSILYMSDPKGRRHRRARAYLPRRRVASEVGKHSREPVVDFVQCQLFFWRFEDGLVKQSDRKISYEHTSTKYTHSFTSPNTKREERKNGREKEEIWSKKAKGGFSQYELRLMAVFNSSMAKFKMELSNCFEFLFLFPYRNINLLVIHKAESKRNAKHFTS